MKTKKFYVIVCDEPKFIVGPGTLDSGPLPIIWRYLGLYGFIPAAIVANVIQNMEYAEKDLELNANGPEPDRFGKFRWSQVISIRNKIGELLFNEQFDNEASNSTNSDHD